MYGTGKSHSSCGLYHAAVQFKDNGSFFVDVNLINRDTTQKLFSHVVKLCFLGNFP